MVARFFPLLVISLLLIGCEKSKRIATEPAERTAGPRVTKSDRPPPDEPPKSRDQLLRAFKKAEEIRSPEDKNRALAAAIWDALDLEPELARQGLQQLTAGSDEKNRLLQHVAMRLAEQNVDDAVKWATALETEDEKSQAFGKIALVLSADEPERAAHLLSDSGVAGREFDVAVVQVVQRWAAQSPSDAAAWVVLFDPGETRSAGLKETLSVWSRNDPQAAFAWIAAVEDEQIHREAVAGMAEIILEQPESAQEEQLKLATPEMRAAFEKLKADAGAQ
ncbi:MAG: hypothetical protein V4819_00500 [Verrucomicrobiota bacterium]